MNRKRVRRLCQLEGLKVLKKRRQRNSRGKTPLLEASHQNHVWSCDFLFDQTANGRMMKLLTVIDIFTRQCYAPPHQVGRFALCAQTCTASQIVFAVTMALSSVAVQLESDICASSNLETRGKNRRF